MIEGHCRELWVLVTGYERTGEHVGFLTVGRAGLVTSCFALRWLVVWCYNGKCEFFWRENGHRLTSVAEDLDLTAQSQCR